jgi:hypothetical protein
MSDIVERLRKDTAHWYDESLAHKAAAEIDRLREERDKFHDALEKIAAGDFAALADENDRLREVLKPFASVQIHKSRTDEENVWHSLKVRDFRRARAALKEAGQ